MDQSYIEILADLEVLTGAVALLLLTLRLKVSIYGAWAATLAAMALDDSLQWHEQAGTWLVTNAPVPDPPGLRAQDLGELAAWAIVGAGLLLLLVLAHRRSSVEAQRHSWRLACLTALLAVFAVALDMITVALRSISTSERLLWALSDLEAAGEAAVMVGLAAYAMQLATRNWWAARPPSASP